MSKTETLFPASFETHVFPAAALYVTAGVNISESLGRPDENCPGDSFMFDPRHSAQKLAVHTGIGNTRFLSSNSETQFVASGSEIGAPGNALIVLARLRFMAQDGEQVDVLLLEPLNNHLFFLPLSPLEAEQSYSLISIEENVGSVRITNITPIAFGRGTRITMHGGYQRPIEDIKPGDLVLSRDGGSFPVRWIGNRTLRAVGTFAPVVITKGTLSNAHDLILGQFQRLYLYQTDLPQLSDQSDLFVRARDLVDNQNIYIRKGGFVDYFHIMLDSHEVIYAECIPTESLLRDPKTLASLPEDLASDLEPHIPDTPQRPHPGRHLDRKTIRAVGPTNLHRRDKN